MDDHTSNGAGESGEVYIHFRLDRFRDWKSVLECLLELIFDPRVVILGGGKPMIEPVFHNAEEWRLHLYSQNEEAIFNLYKQNSESGDFAVLVLDLRDKFAKALKNFLISELEVNENTLNLVIHTSMLEKVIGVLNEQRKHGFTLGSLIYDDQKEVAVCVVAAAGATFFAVQNLKC